MAAVRHDMTQGFVLTQYFYEQLLQFEKDPASLKDSIGEMVYSMDIDQQVHRARQIQFDQQADEDVLERSKPRKLEGLDLAEARLAMGDIGTASAMARQALTEHADTLHLLGLLCVHTKQLDHAVEWLWRAIRREPKPLRSMPSC